MKTNKTKSAVKIAKVRKTDYRPQASPAAPDAWDHLNAINRREQAEHDKALAGYSEHTLRAMAADLGGRHCWERSDPQQRWIMHRLAAALRMLDRFFCQSPPAGRVPSA